jgi:hypothetical protein
VDRHPAFRFAETIGERISAVKAVSGSIKEISEEGSCFDFFGRNEEAH